MTRPRVRWIDAPWVYLRPPACPHCGANGYDRVRTQANGDGSFNRRVICRACRLPYVICVELPDPGSFKDGAG